jgi:hypothetical protein
MIRISACSFARVALMLGLLAPCALVSAQDLVDNPQYTTWSKHKPESTITFAMNTDAAGQQMAGTVVHRLMEVTPDQATVELKTTVQVMGQPQTSSTTAVYKAKVPKADAEVTKVPKNVKGTGKEVGDEKVQVGEKSINCKVVEFEGQMNEMQNSQVKGKMWRSEEVPGGLVKMQSDIQGAMAVKILMTLQAMDLK